MITLKQAHKKRHKQIFAKYQKLGGTMKKQSITINTSQISTYRGRAIGKAFYNAYMNFIRDPENEKLIEERAKEIRARKTSEQTSTTKP